jgi:CelD/BcsL family acetyltransferase involved in cellulose biosynthesis
VLPPTWDDFIEQMSKTARRTIRKTFEDLESLPGKNIRIASTPNEIRENWHILVDLHQRRRQSLGETGCFDYPPFGEFLLQATVALAEQQLAELVILETEGHPVAIQHIVKSTTSYATYQSGINPDRSDISPGRLLVAHCIRQAVERGYREFDFLRGDEEYKIRWRGTERPMSEIRIIAPTVSAKLRHQVWLTGSRVKSWIKSYQN